MAGGMESEADAAKNRLVSLLDSGQAREKFAHMVSAQGGDFEAERKVAQPFVLSSKHAGYVSDIHAGKFGRAVVQLGGGRQKLGGAIDPSVGIELCVEIGETVEPGQELVRIFAHYPPADPWMDALLEAIQISPEKPPAVPLIIDHVTANTA